MNPLPQKIRTLSIATLSSLLATSLGLYLVAKQAHWVVQGPSFGPLHKLFGEVAEAADSAADLLAERIVQLDGIPSREVTSFELTGRDDINLAHQIGIVLSKIGADNLAGIEGLLAANDQVSANLLIGIEEEGIEKLIWKVESFTK